MTTFLINRTTVRTLVLIAFFSSNIFVKLSAQRATLLYKESLEDFANPERGFYIPKDALASGFVPLDFNVLRNYRTTSQAHGSASYKVFATLFYRGYVLDIFRDKPLSPAFLHDLDGDFAVARSAGVKLIIRFAYTNRSHRGDCPNKAICPPYGDAPKEIVLHHIAQLKPLLTKNADVIAVLQQGFIGIWGENYFTDYFGFPGDDVGRIMDSSWRDRNEVLKALLSALPKDRMVQVRTPQMKQKFVYGPKAAVTAGPITEKEAFNFSDKARIGFHNDCFLAGPDDYGTFYDNGSSETAKKPANLELRKYFEADSRYGAVGGETCDDTYSPQNDCGPAEKAMAAMHYSYLNTAYNNKVNNDWDSAGCINTIKKNLGYRIVLRSATLPVAVKAGWPFSFTLNMENVGYAAPYNPRTLRLIFRNRQTGQEFFLPCKTDIRFWFSGRKECRETLYLPKNMTRGSYDILLNLPDKYASIAKNPAYSIRLANENMWEEKTGYNNLRHQITVSK